MEVVTLFALKLYIEAKPNWYPAVPNPTAHQKLTDDLGTMLRTEMKALPHEFAVRLVFGRIADYDPGESSLRIRVESLPYTERVDEQMRWFRLLKEMINSILDRLQHRENKDRCIRPTFELRVTFGTVMTDEAIEQIRAGERR